MLGSLIGFGGAIVPAITDHFKSKQNQEFELRDDGLGGDSIAGDDIWSIQTALLVNDGSIAQVEVWAIDGEVVSPILFGQLPI